uniref:Uncharacterized protein n=1 Tax=Propithecus coquereli TaxID=379532 RepID=A0A2K6FN53_PROCO
MPFLVSNSYACPGPAGLRLEVNFCFYMQSGVLGFCSGACVIDRDGHLFKYLLDYLHGEVQIPTDEQTRVALQEEADYFGIPYPYSLSDHLANEMETYSLRSNIELKKALTDFCDSYGLVFWVLHYLNTSGASCESRIIGVYATKTDGTDAIDKQLGGRIHSKSIFKREAGNNVQYIWSYYSVAELKKMMDAFDLGVLRLPMGLGEQRMEAHTCRQQRRCSLTRSQHPTE